MRRTHRHLVLAALCCIALAACGASDQDTAASGHAAVDRIVAQESRNARKPDAGRGIEIRRLGFETIFAGTAIQYGATFKEDKRIDLRLSAHRLAGQQMLQSGAALDHLPMVPGTVTIAPDPASNAPAMTLTGVPGYENVSLRMREGTIDIVSLLHEKEQLTDLPVIKGFALDFEGRFVAVSDDASEMVAEPEGNRGVAISGAVRYHVE